MGYIGQAPANKVVTSADIEDGVVSAADLAANSVDSSELVDGSIDLSHLSASGTKSSSTYFRGDNSFATISAGGDLSFGGDTFGANKVVGANDAYSFSLETSGNTALTISANGEITKPLQPCFFATLPNETISDFDCNPTMRFNNEVFDKNADYNTGTFTFTAPVTGSYVFYFALGISGMSAEGNDWYVELRTSNFSARTPRGLQPRLFANLNVNYLFGASVVDMDASDTAYVTGNSYDDDTLETYPEKSWFSGYLMG